jgi:integrase
MSQSGYILPPCTLGLKRKPRPKIIPFTREEMKQIFAAIRPTCRTGIRDLAFYALMYRGAMRIGATLRIMPTDFDWDRHLVRVYKDKGGKTRTISLDGKTMAMLATWRDKRASLGVGDDKPFFCTHYYGSLGQQLSYPSRLDAFKKLARRAGITRYVNLHLLRHTGASELLEEGFDVPTIARVLGHSNILTTYRYLHELRPDLMNTRLKQREW